MCVCVCTCTYVCHTGMKHACINKTNLLNASTVLPFYKIQDNCVFHSESDHC